MLLIFELDIQNENSSLNLKAKHPQFLLQGNSHCQASQVLLFLVVSCNLPREKQKSYIITLTQPYLPLYFHFLPAYTISINHLNQFLSVWSNSNSEDVTLALLEHFVKFGVLRKQKLGWNFGGIWRTNRDRFLVAIVESLKKCFADLETGYKIMLGTML